MSMAGECQSHLWHVKLGIPIAGIKMLTFVSLWIFNPKDLLFSIIKIQYEEKARWENKCDVFNIKTIEQQQRRTSVRLGVQVRCWGFGRCPTGWTIARNQAAVHSAPSSRSWEESQKIFQSDVQTSGSR